MSKVGEITFAQVVELLEDRIREYDQSPETLALSGLFEEARDLITSDPCLMGLQPGESYFVLRGQDQLAPSVIKYWLGRCENAGARLTPEKVNHAAETIRDMESWGHRKLPD